MFRVAICDDSPADLEILHRYLDEFKHGVPLEIVSYRDGKELADDYKKKNTFDLIILDMMMEHLNGIETARRIRTVDKDVILLIVTGTVEYAIEGYTVNASRYIVKPIEKNEFFRTLHNIVTLLEKRQEHIFTFPSISGFTRLDLEDIYYFESQLRQIRVVSSLGSYTYTGKISQIEEQTREHGFIRIHKSFIANMRHIHNIFKDSVTMDNREILPLSRHKHKEVQQQFLSFVEGELI